MNGFVAGCKRNAGLVARTIHERNSVPGSRFRARALTAVAVAAGCACAILTPAAMGDTTDLAPNWQVSSSASVTDTGGSLSQAGFDTAAWLKVKTNDANAVGSEVAAEMQNIPADSQCGANNIFYGENITACQGAQPGAHDAPLATSRYGVPWWFRTEFTPEPQARPERRAAGPRDHGQGRPVGQRHAGLHRRPSSRAPSPSTTSTSRA